MKVSVLEDYMFHVCQPLSGEDEKTIQLEK